MAKSSFAQSGTVNGHLVDSMGAAIQGAQVTITSTTTKAVEKAVTNGQGYFLFPPLVPGEYVIHATATGFAEETVDKVMLEVAGSRTFDLTLKPQGTSQDVTVTATSAALVVDTPDRGNVIESQFVANTPLNIRNPLQLVNFAQGVSAYSADSGNNDSSQSLTNTFRINGGKLATTESLLDGGANTTLYDLNAISAVPTVDSILEFKVLTSPYSAEWGRTSGGVVTYAQKSGTDRFHGSVFDYIRNSATDANTFNADGAPSTNPVTGVHLPYTPKPHFERNQFGFAVGGPVAFTPKQLKGTHKTFFFVAYEGLRQSSAGSFTYTVPTALERNGDFSRTTDAKGNLITIYDPTSTTLVPAGGVCGGMVQTSQTYCRNSFLAETGANKIPTSMIDKVGSALLSNYPMPTSTSQGTIANNFFSATPIPTNQNTVGFRLDHKFTEKHSVFGHYDWFQRWNYFGSPFPNGLSPTANHQRLPGDNIMAEHVWVMSPTIVFQHHFVYAHQESNRTPSTLGFDPLSLGFTNPNVSSNLATTTFPSITAMSSSGPIGAYSPLGPQSGLEADGGTTFQYAGDVSWLKGKHNFKFGWDFRVLEEDYDINQQLTEKATGNNSAIPFTAGPNALSVSADSGSGVADLLLGAATVTTGIAPGVHIDHPYWAFYGQDQFHMTPKLSITVGLRYSVELPDQEKGNTYPYLDPNIASPLSVPGFNNLTGGLVYANTNGVGRRLQITQKNNFDPRIGFAYQWNQKTVVRGGFGIFHAPSLDATENGTNYGYSAVTTSNPAQANQVTPVLNLDNPFSTGILQPSGNSLGLLTNVGVAVSGTPRQQINSYSNQWSVDLQRELPKNFVVTVGYVGNHGVHLYAPYNYNQIPDSAYAMGSALNTSQVANPFYKIVTTPGSPLLTPTVAQGYLLTPHPQFQTMYTTLSSIGESSYNALQLSIEHRFSNGLALLYNYTRSHIVDDVGDYFADAQPQDNHCIKCDLSTSGQDVRNIMRLSAQYELPFGPGKAFATRGWASQVIGGWSLGSFYTFDDGLPVQVTQTGDPNLFGAGSVQRPNATGTSPFLGAKFPHLYPGVAGVGIYPYFQTAAFTAAPAYTFGNAPRFNGDIRAPGANNWDLLLTRRFQLPETYALTFSFQAFNAFNRIQFSAPTGTGCPITGCSSSSTFGTISVTQLSGTSSRSLQASLRFSF